MREIGHEDRGHGRWRHGRLRRRTARPGRRGGAFHRPRRAPLGAIRDTGLRIESPYGDAHLTSVAATDDPSTVGPVDVVIFTVKLFDTEAAAERLAPLIGERTRVVTLQNGIDSRAMIARHVPAERIVAGCIYVSAAIGAPGVIRSPGGPQRMIVDGLGGDPGIAALVAACSRAPGLEASATDAIAPSIWEKFVTLAAFSGATCLTRRPDRRRAGASRDARLPEAAARGERGRGTRRRRGARRPEPPSASSGSSAPCPSGRNPRCCSTSRPAGRSRCPGSPGASSSSGSATASRSPRTPPWWRPSPRTSARTAAGAARPRPPPGRVATEILRESDANPTPLARLVPRAPAS